MLKKHFFVLLVMLKIIFVKTLFSSRILWWMESSKEQHLFEIEIFCNSVKYFTVTFNQLNASMLYKCIISIIILFLSSQIFHQAPDPNVPLPQPQSHAGSRRSRAICLSSGPRKPKSLYAPSMCLADADSESHKTSHPHISHSLLGMHPLGFNQ